MVEAGEDAPFGKESLLEQIHMPVIKSECLKRVVHSKLLVNDLVYRTHAAHAERPYDAVGADAVVWEELLQRATVSTC